MKLNISSNSVEFQIHVLEHRDVPIFIVLFLYETLGRLTEKFKEEVKRRKWRKLDYKLLLNGREVDPERKISDIEESEKTIYAVPKISLPNLQQTRSSHRFQPYHQEAMTRKGYATFDMNLCLF